MFDELLEHISIPDKWNTSESDIYIAPEVKDSIGNRLFIVKGKKLYGRRAKLVINPFFSIAGDSIDSVYEKIRDCSDKGLFNNSLVSMDISVRYYDDYKRYTIICVGSEGKVLNDYLYVRTSQYIKQTERGVTSVCKNRNANGDFYKRGNWYYSDTTWYDLSVASVDWMAIKFWDIVATGPFRDQDDIIQIRVTFNKVGKSKLL